MKSNKIYIIGAITLVLGIIIFFIASLMVGFNYNKLSTDNYVKKQLTYETLNNLNIKEKNNNIKIIKSNDNLIHITYYKGENEKYKITKTKDTLNYISSYKKITKNNWYDNISFNFNNIDTTTIIKIPQNYNENINITTDGYLKINNINSNNININTKYDDTNINGLNATNLSLKSKNASLNLKNINIKNNVDLKTTNGDIDLENINSNNINTKTTSAYIKLKNANILNNALLKTDNEDIILNNVNIGTKLECNAKNANIKGTINGSIKDFNTTSKTTNGKNNLPKQLNIGKKILNINTTNGDINIKFTN